MYHYLNFEKSIACLDNKVAELKKIALSENKNSIIEEINNLEQKIMQELCDIYKKLNPWQKTQVARHPNRPHFLDYSSHLFTDYTPLSGDRKFADDKALQAGFARFYGESIAFIGIEKGHDTKTRLKYNFGSARPEGYRKAVRIMKLAEKFDIPIISIVDTSGAYPGISAEERGQAEAIARSIETMLNIKVPIISIIIGEGGSGGAIAIAIANYVYMLEHAIYSVISPEGAAAILWQDTSKAEIAALNMKITAQDLYNLKVIDGIIQEPIGGAHRNHKEMIQSTGKYIIKSLRYMKGKNGDTLLKERREKYLKIGKNL